MVDTIDKVNDDVLMVTDIDINNVLRSSKKLTITGFCHNCESKIEAGEFCDKDCADDYSKREFMRSGRK